MAVSSGTKLLLNLGLFFALYSDQISGNDNITGCFSTSYVNKMIECTIAGSISEDNSLWHICENEKNVTVGVLSTATESTSVKFNIPDVFFKNCDKLKSLTLTSVETNLHLMAMPDHLDTLILHNFGINNLSYDLSQNFPNFLHLEKLSTYRINLQKSLKHFLCYLPNLLELEIDNGDVMLEDGLFSTQKKLKVLKLLTNNFENIKQRIFSSLTSLQSLLLTANNIKTIDENAFEGLGQLEELHLSSNLIERINYENFQGLKSLKILRLDGNKIDHLPDSVFKHLESLVELYINNNSLKSLNHNAFHGLSKLKTLQLSANEINEMDEEIFNDLISLEHLYLKHNKITFFPYFLDIPFFKKLRSLSRRNDIKLIISDNPLICSCRNIWLMTDDMDLTCLTSNGENIIMSEWKKNEGKDCLDYKWLDSIPFLGLSSFSVQSEDGILIAYQHKSPESSSVWINVVNDLLRPYQNTSLMPGGGQNQVECDFNKTLATGKACAVELTEFGDCIAENGYGFPQGAPCIFIMFDKIYGWLPEYYNDVDNLPSDMPTDLKNYIKSLPENERNQVWISCQGASPADRGNLNSIKYLPRQGFPSYYFPYTNTTGYLSPLVAVKLDHLQFNILINIECRAWAKNIIFSENSDQQGSGSVSFEVLID